MSHHVYTTEGIVIGSAPYGEAHKLISLYTRDLGLVTAVAQGVRKNESKLRFHTQDKNFAKFSLVKGKEMWRLTGALGFFRDKLQKENRIPVERLVFLIKRMVQGEEKHEEIYDLIDATYEACQNFEKIKPELKQIQLIEIIAVLRLCNFLGYVKNNEKISSILDDYKDFGENVLLVAKNNKEVIVETINQGLKASHL